MCLTLLLPLYMGGEASVAYDEHFSAVSRPHSIQNARSLPVVGESRTERGTVGWEAAEHIPAADSWA